MSVANSRKHRSSRQCRASRKQCARLSRQVSVGWWGWGWRGPRRAAAWKNWTRSTLFRQFRGINWARLTANFPDPLGDTVWELPKGDDQ